MKQSCIKALLKKWFVFPDYCPMFLLGVGLFFPLVKCVFNHYLLGEEYDA